MGKRILFFLLLALTLASAAGYFFLNDQISAGEKKIAQGEKQLADGKKQLAAGQAKLRAGQQQLARGKTTYNAVKTIPLGGLGNLLPKAKPIFDLAQNKVAEGKQKIAEGEKQIAAGKKQLADGQARYNAGKLQLAAGKEKIALAKQIRDWLGMSAIVFLVLTVLFGVYAVLHKRKLTR